MSAATINPHEAAHFGALAADWWDPHGSSAMLHKLNPVRLSYIRDQIDAHWHVDARERYALAGRAALDVGCGAGLLAEPLARMGAKVTGVDAAPENIAAAQGHAAGQGLSISYFAGELAALPPSTFDLVTSMEVVEHVTDPAAFIGELAARLAPGGLMILSTPNRTMLSKLLLVEAAERVGAVPRGTHDWDQFLKPEELTKLLEGAGLEVVDRTGLSPSPAKGFKLGGSEALNYLVAARWPG
ncbi:bifunctional 3-demethylubiquinone 3-O-methyltransferase/2-octaprenyl-6-hydroxy phenol methylase [Sphingopyxis sp. H038]|uniref:bifunctional 2-polyprenyl-6-hydroxyphenol methylase/3-demethylubiquinol 3-O-methyltransferase UbiG n=1 Tax=unclassified Sphingopyxis TaxID=2614943 RepID=UPI0007303D5B|nr:MULTISPECIES: bifunctional 2-polyprenyl-6-hydroxyphenol methylase/3-demethylubiquinol 3-O-methyltransferase UbiG [unclassified Sphingopyxis]KTE00793.1 bifunctional 3-demethylubiquinone 3-O-methyltransferase/2-octaprenyl-6-hydroxy phenol methylase [Sphingopyxis sp. H012]KTE11738.1 bifunctional 3-demethylubiquinone 3-O-methyltransferase/2-octaprenyl-6-hydroxy phenol methylase [Sphingopyxis sp. H053]KTE16357.1 bifunctional 3-demethylubiquinone 3-O-methyltransferase/2-octaprenyl-6-hydroxy phenol 